MLTFEISSPDGFTRRGDYPERDLAIGRDEANTLVLPHANVSRFHAVIILRDTGEYVLRDVGSRNGLLVNGTRKFRHPLRPGDTIGIAPFQITFLGPRTPAAESAAGLALRMPKRPPTKADTSITATGAVANAHTTLRALGPGGSALAGADFHDRDVLHLLCCAQAIASAPSATKMAGEVLGSVLATLKAGQGFLLVCEGDRLHWRASLPAQRPPDTLDTLDTSAICAAIDQRSPMVSAAADGDGLDMLCLPLVAGKDVVGVVGVEGHFRDPAPMPGLALATALCNLSAAHLANAREHARLEQQCARLFEAVQATHRLVGCSRAFLDLYGQVSQAAQCDFPVLILGETGAGKDLVAHAIHHMSKRREYRLVDMNCAALPETLLESEMFGYGPHSGIANADPQGKPGKFEVADGGSLFLNEICDMSPNLQAKFLTVLDRHSIVRLGSNEPVPVDTRLLAATNRDINAHVARGQFREDLYGRIKCLEIKVPPLRERPCDILLLAAYFLEQHLPGPLSEALQITHETAQLLLSYRWPRNVRELRNAVLAASMRATAGSIDPEHFDREIADYLGGSVVRTLDQVEKDHIAHVLHATRGNKRKAAKLLGISHQTLHDKVKNYGIELEDKTHIDSRLTRELVQPLEEAVAPETVDPRQPPTPGRGAACLTGPNPGRARP